MGRTKLGRDFCIHRPTGVLQMRYLRDGKDMYPQGEPMHVLVEGEIEADREKRKHGVWAASDDPHVIYFTCPWCGTIGTSDAQLVNSGASDSVVCGSSGHAIQRIQPRSCMRHLTLFYRHQGNEEKNFMNYDALDE